MRQRKVAGYPNYDKSEFDSVSALYDGDEEKLKEVWATQYPLSEFVDPANYKSYDELKTRLETVLGGSQPTNTAENTSVDDVVTTDTTSEAAPQKSVEPDSEEDALSYFQRLSEED